MGSVLGMKVNDEAGGSAEAEERSREAGGAAKVEVDAEEAD